MKENLTSLHMKKYLFGLLLLSACSAKKEDAVEIQTLEVSTPISIDTTIYQQYVADIHAIQNVEIRARVKGYLDRILVDEGKQVKKGQIMFTINNQEYVAELARAKAVIKSSLCRIESGRFNFD